jgi:hypothetical protein
MGRRIRVYEPNRVYSAVIRCVDRQFLLRPDHDRKNPLLAAGCSPLALDKSNDLTPFPSVIDVIGVAAARAQQLYPIQIHWVEANINHLTVGFSADADHLANIPEFFKAMNSYVAVKINVKLVRDGHVFSGPYRATPCLDEMSAEQQLLYCLTNPVKDGLVESVAESPFFTCFRALARGGSLRFWRINWKAYDLAGAARKKSHRPKDYLEWFELELSPLPEQAEWPGHRRSAWVRAQVRDIEQAVRDEFRAVGRKAMGVDAQFRADPRSRPLEPKDAGPQPLCHASNAEDRREFRRTWQEVVRAHRAASIDYRLGYWEREFPVGTFRPPITAMYQPPRL